jgi:hypothetical protein
MNNLKSYKIIVHSKKMRNIHGTSPAEVAKKVALKLLVKNIYSMYFSIVEIKTNKIIHYQSNKKELLRPYHKNGKLVKFRIVVKKIKKQIGGTYEPNLEDPKDPIYTFFTKEKYEISLEETEYFGKLIKIKDLHENDCLYIVFKSLNNSENDYIELFKLNRCHFQGSTNLQSLIKYAQHLKNTLKINLNYITLEDTSSIPSSDIQLWLLSILTTGESWYNRFGFKSHNYNNEKIENNKIIKMNIIDFIKFIDECILIYKTNRKKLNLQNTVNAELIEKIKFFFKKYDQTKTVQDIFIEIKNELKENRISPEDIYIIEKIFHIIYLSNKILYNPFLCFTIE